jgi:outer membrane protein assembly factor BamB/tetratricopeptide (TPR) repeat protein
MGTACAKADEVLDRVTLAGESVNAGRQLQAARQLAQNKSWPQAVAEYQQLIDSVGDELVLIDPRHAVALRWLCHLDIVRWPADALKLYRSRMDAQAARWLEEGIRNRDERQLLRVVLDAFPSMAGARAIDALGDLAFERGQFDEARRWYRLLTGPLPPPEAQNDSLAQLAYPAADVPNLALVRAKQVLILLFQGDKDRFVKELEAFVALHPGNEGTLAGRKGTYADTLKALAKDGEGPRLPWSAEAWPTFAGDASRSRSIPGDVDRLARACAPGPYRRYDLVKREAVAPEKPRAGDRTALAFHPIVLEDRVLTADGRRITAYGITSADAEIWYDVEKDLKVSMGKQQLPAPPFLRHTLTAAEGHILARLGPDAIGEEPARPGEPVRSTCLVCLRQRPNRKGERLCWTASAGEPGSKNGVAYFEGSPVVQDGRVYIASSTVHGGQDITHIQCFALDVDSETPVPPRRLWKQEVCTIKEDRSELRFRHHLLTLAGRNVVYASHSGAIVAVDALTGQHVWARRYRSRGPNLAPDLPSPRDLAPCVYALGRLYVAPQDDDKVICLDPATGDILWEREGIEVVHLLGVGKGKLIFTTYSQPRGIRAIDALTGDDAGGWIQPGDDRLFCLFGRGILFGGAVLWPILDGIYVVSQEDGSLVYAPMVQGVAPGNLAYADGCLAVADLRELRLYVSPARQRGELEAWAESRPDSPAALLRLAEARADEGAAGPALDLCRRAADLASSLPEGRRSALLAQSVGLRHQALLVRARAAGRSGDTPAVEKSLLEAAGPEFPAPLRIQALRQLARQPGHGITAWQSVVTDPILRSTPTADDRGIAVLGGMLAKGQFELLFESEGPQAAHALDFRAAELLQGEKKLDRQELLERVATEFPTTTAARQALPELARLHESAGRWGAAARAWRQSLDRCTEKEQRALALAQLAQCYERQECWEAARETWQRLAREAPDSAPPAPLPQDQTLGRFIGEQLKRPEYASATPPATPRWLHRWHLCLEPGEHLLAGQGRLDSRLPAEWFTAGGGLARCRESGSGKVRWSVAVPASLQWCGRWLDLVLMSGPDLLLCFSIADGNRLWQLSRADNRGTFSEFRLAGGRLFFLHGGNRLLAVDPISGMELWNVTAPPGQHALPRLNAGFQPNYMALSEHLIVQTEVGPVLVLDARTGNTEHRISPAGALGEQGQPPSPLLLRDAVVCIALDLENVVAFDCSAGKEMWRHRLPLATNRTGHWPVLAGGGSTLAAAFSINLGWFVESLDPRTGASLWERAHALGAADVIQSISVSVDAVLHASGGELIAEDAKSGRTLWRAALPQPNSHFSRAHGGSVLAGANVARATRISFRWLFWSVECQSSPTVPRGGLVLSCHDARTGQLTQRLDFRLPDARPVAAIDLRTGLWWQPGVIVDHPRNSDAPAMCLFADAMLLQVGSEAWRLGL